MIHQLRDKKVIFFDVGYTLDMPASGDWMFTKRFLEEAGDGLKRRGDEEISRARDKALRFLAGNHLVTTVEAEIEQFYRYYSIISDELDLALSEEQLRQTARDRACNMANYVPYPGVREVLETLSRTHRLGIISDTWPSIEQQLEYIGVSRYFSFATYSCFLGVFKPDPRMYRDALAKSGVSAGKTVFIDDSVANLDGAAAMGILPVLIAANPASDVETSWLKIRDLRELLS
jgi:HAD superfamily hydrolase (TIGR01509 family)